MSRSVLSTEGKVGDYAYSYFTRLDKVVSRIFILFSYSLGQSACATQAR